MRYLLMANTAVLQYNEYAISEMLTLRSFAYCCSHQLCSTGRATQRQKWQVFRKSKTKGCNLSPNHTAMPLVPLPTKVKGGILLFQFGKSGQSQMCYCSTEINADWLIVSPRTRNFLIQSYSYICLYPHCLMLYYLIHHTNTKVWFSNILAQYGLKHNPPFTKHQLKPSGMFLTFPTAPVAGTLISNWGRLIRKNLGH